MTCPHCGKRSAAWNFCGWYLPITRRKRRRWGKPRLVSNFTQGLWAWGYDHWFLVCLSCHGEVSA
jgi:hypothetical protein